jgi:hypothetical protein
MPENTSATGGILAPQPAPAPVPLTDDELRDALQPIFAGITGLDPDSGVRPSFQPDPPPLPDPEVSWMAFSVTTIGSDDEASQQEHDDGEGMTMRRDERVEVLCSFLGPRAQAYAGVLRDGLEVEQNRAGLYALGIGYVGAADPLRVPDKRNGRWVDRWDFRLTLIREVRREYRVLSLLGAGGVVVGDQGGETATVREFATGVTPEA